MVHLRNRENASVAGIQTRENMRRVGNKVREEDRNQLHRRPNGGGHKDTCTVFQ